MRACTSEAVVSNVASRGPAAGAFFAALVVAPVRALRFAVCFAAGFGAAVFFAAVFFAAVFFAVVFCAVVFFAVVFFAVVFVAAVFGVAARCAAGFFADDAPFRAGAFGAADFVFAVGFFFAWVAMGAHVGGSAGVVASAMSELHALPLVSVEPIAARQALLVVDATGTPVHRGHTAAGQYLQLGLFDDDVPRPVAIACRPGPARLEFLLKGNDERIARVLSLQVGERVRASVPLGRGFPLDQARGRDLWMFGVGSGIAPLKAVIERVLDERVAFGDVVLYYGVRHVDELAFRRRFGTWLGQGIRVVPVVSRALPADGWDGLTGHVQDHLPKTLPRAEQSVAFVCGLPEMEKAVGAALLERGVGPERVLRNW
jgi:NAD(P)H-flavin reductase